MADNKLINEQIRAELEPEMKESADRMYQKGLRDAGGAGAANHADAPAYRLAKRAQEIRGQKATAGVTISNEEAVRLAYEEAGVPLG